MKTKDRRMVEAFEFYSGGTLEKDVAQFNEKLKGKVEAEELAPILAEFLRYFEENKEPNEFFFDFKQRVGIEVLQEALDEILGVA